MPATQPNILWIVTTQWRASATGYAGDVNARTPNLDAFAAQSVNYTQAVTPHPFGPFARAAMLTGVPSPENGVKNYYDPLPIHARTIAHTMKERGYATSFIGKWHLAERDPAAPLVGEAHAKMIVPPEQRGGFDFWEGFESGFQINDPWLHGTELPEPVQMRGYQSDVLVARSIARLEPRTSNIEHPKSNVRNESQRPHLPSSISHLRGASAPPWFCVVSLEAPHPPYDAPAAGIAPVAPDKIVLAANVPRGGDVEAKARKELAGYYAHIEATDRAIGGLLAAVSTETIVIFTSVHGDMHGAHGLFRKGWPHEESIRVPLLLRRSGEAARNDESAVSLIDLAEMTESWADGKAWSCPRKEAAISMPSVVALPYQCDRAWSGVRSAKAKRVWNADGSEWAALRCAGI